MTIPRKMNVAPTMPARVILSSKMKWLRIGTTMKARATNGYARTKGISRISQIHRSVDPPYRTSADQKDTDDNKEENAAEPVSSFNDCDACLKRIWPTESKMAKAKR